MSDTPTPVLTAQVKEQFALEYYKWSLKKGDEEIADDFASMRSFGNSASLQFLHTVSRLDKAQTRDLVRALIKRRHGSALAVLGESLDFSEQRAFAFFKQSYLESRPVIGPSLQNIDRKDSFRAGFKRKVFDVLKSNLTAKLRISIKGPLEFPLTIRTIVSNREVITHFDVNAESASFDYDQAVFSRDGLALREGISLLGWLGLGPSKWICRNNAEATQAIDQAIGAVKTFQEDFLSGLGPMPSGESDAPAGENQM